MRILLTGGSGFIGTAFARKALAKGHTLAAMSRRPPNAKDEVNGMEWLQGSMADPPLRAIEKFRPEACVHAAWIATPGIYLEAPENVRWVQWSSVFLSAVAEMGVEHITALGTCIEYKMTGSIVREETTPIEPVSLYAKSKVELHARLRSSLKRETLPLTWARIFYPYGEGEHPNRLISHCISRLRANEPLCLNQPHAMKDYIHVEDVATALLTVTEQKFDGPVNIGTGEGVAVGSIARQLAELLNRPDFVLTQEVPAEGAPDFVIADSSRLRSLGWRPEVSLNVGLRRLVEATL